MSDCVDGGDCGPEIVQRSSGPGTPLVWCCVWCGMPLDSETLEKEGLR